MKKYDWKNEYNPIRRTAKRLLSGEPLTDGRPLSDLIELDEHAPLKMPWFCYPSPTARLICCRSWAICLLSQGSTARNVRTAPPRWTSVSMAFADDALFFKKEGPGEYTQAQIDRANAVSLEDFSPHTGRDTYQKADGNTAGKNMTA